MTDAIADFAARVRAAHAEAPPRKQDENKVLRPTDKTERELQLIAEFAAFDHQTRVTVWTTLMKGGSDELPFACFVHFLFARDLLDVFRNGVPEFLTKEKVT